MSTIIRIIGISGLTIFILCMNVNGKPIFEPLYSIMSHVTVPFQNVSRSLLSSAFTSVQDYSRRLFQNSVPKVRDSVKSRVSAPSRKTGAPSEEILAREKEQLDELIKSH